MDDVVGRIGAPGELLENHLTFGVEFGLGEPRIDENVEQGVQTEVEFPGRNPSVKGGVLLGRERVEITAHGIDALSDVLCGSSRRPLEQQVFEKVRDARQLGGSSRLPTPIHAPIATIATGAWTR